MKNSSVKDSALFPTTPRQRPLFRFGLLLRLVGTLVLTALIALPSGSAWGGGIVLDPGHGGNDSGAGQGFEFTEKSLTLSLAQMIAAQINPKYQAELTRNADIELTPADRAGFANHLKADLMVSIHGGVAPYCSHRSAAVYYHDDDRLVMPPAKRDQGSAADSGRDRLAWERLQTRHRQKSRAIAETIRKALADSDSFDNVVVRSAPLATLMGADMPAVLLEMGCFNPATPLSRKQFEQALNDYAVPLARAIAAAMEDLRE